jgi:ribosomal protein L12E/L44/L45/RPP1/RPP2
MKDKDFLAEADRLQLSVSALDGAKLQDVVTTIYASPAAVVARAKELIKE